jgi:hypothetical protein
LKIDTICLTSFPSKQITVVDDWAAKATSVDSFRAEVVPITQKLSETLFVKEIP